VEEGLGEKRKAAGSTGGAEGSTSGSQPAAASGSRPAASMAKRSKIMDAMLGDLSDSSSDGNSSQDDKDADEG
jgi:hypothetical protein